jgi:hypothetical protein
MKHPFYTLYYTGISVLVLGTIFLASILINLRNLLPFQFRKDNRVNEYVIQGTQSKVAEKSIRILEGPKKLPEVKVINKPTVVGGKKSITVHDTVHHTEHDTVHDKTKSNVIDTNSSKTP